MKRSGLGEYDTADRFHTTRYFRFLFLHRAAALEPELRPYLAETIESLPAATFEVPEYLDGGGADEWSRAFDEHRSRFERICTAIAPWQKRWHLADDWIPGELYLALVFVRRDLPATDRVRESWKYFDREPVGPFSPIYPPTGGLPVSRLRHPQARLRPRALWCVQARVSARLFRSGCNLRLVRRFSHDFVPRARRQTSESSGFSADKGAGEGVK